MLGMKRERERDGPNLFQSLPSQQLCADTFLHAHCEEQQTDSLYMSLTTPDDRLTDFRNVMGVTTKISCPSFLDSLSVHIHVF